MRNSAKFDFGYTIYSAMALTPAQFSKVQNVLNLDQTNARIKTSDIISLNYADNGLAHLQINHTLAELADPIKYENLLAGVLQDGQVCSYMHTIGKDNNILLQRYTFDRNGRLSNSEIKDVILRDFKSAEDVSTILDHQALPLSGTFNQFAYAEHFKSSPFNISADLANLINNICALYNWGGKEKLELIDLETGEYCFAHSSHMTGVLQYTDHLNDDAYEELGEYLSIEALLETYIKPVNPDRQIELTSINIGHDQSRFTSTVI